MTTVPRRTFATLLAASALGALALAASARPGPRSRASS